MSSVNGPFRVYSVSITCLYARNFVISAIVFLIAIARCAINSVGGLRCVIREKAPKTKSVSIIPL